MAKILNDAYAVLLPAIADLNLTTDLEAYFHSGGRTLLLGESRDEYVARRMSDQRVREETADQFKSLTNSITAMAGSPLIAMDQEPAGIQRLHQLAPHFPDVVELSSMGTEDIEKVAYDVARAAKSLGANMFLAPIADVVTGKNVWLHGRTLGVDIAQVARICSAFIRGAESAGVITTPKHFPGHHDITLDPAIDLGVVTGHAAHLQPGFKVFKDILAANPSACMIGPALVPAVDPDEPSSTSSKTVKMLREAFNFNGMIVSDDLDGKATLAGRTIEQTAIAAIRAGADLLLIAAGPQIHSIAEALSEVAKTDTQFMDRLSTSARVVKNAAELRRVSA